MQRLIPILFTLFLAACQTPVNRQPNQITNSFDQDQITLLKWAAKNRILFQIDEKSFQDVASSKVDATCESLSEPAWSQLVSVSLKALRAHPEFKNSVHIIEVKPASTPLARINQDLDGLTYLTLEYAKNVKTKVIQETLEIPCAVQSASLLGQTRTDTTFVYPKADDIISAVKKIKKSETPERWNFKTQFLEHLADNLTVFRLTSDVSFEKSFDGEPLLVHFLNLQAEQVVLTKTEKLKYWLAEINSRSFSGSYLNLFSLQADPNLSQGILTVEKSFGVAMPFMSYKIEAGKFQISQLSQLEKCLSDLTNRYRRSLASIGSDLSTAPQNFLYPGFSCR